MSFREQRRFPRVSITPALAEMSSALSAHVTWPNLETSEITDVSYRGVAARRPGIFEVKLQNEIDIEVTFGVEKPFKSQARIAWTNSDSVGLELKTIPADGHKAMSEFLDAKLAGAGLRPIDRAYISPDQTFEHWYQGSGWDVFVWMNEQRLIDRVMLNSSLRSVEFERGGAVPMEEGDKRKALLILSQMDKHGLPMEEFLRTLGASIK